MRETPKAVSTSPLMDSKNDTDITMDNPQERLEVLTCRFCGFQTKTLLSAHLRGSHNINIPEYRKQYPDDKLVTEALKQQQLGKRKATWMKKFGVPHPIESMTKARKKLGEMLSEYGLDNVGQVAILNQNKVDKIRKTTLKRHGVKNPAQIGYVREINGLKHKQLWNTTEFQTLQAERRKAKCNIAEKQIETELAGNLRFTGNGSLWIPVRDGRNRNPDFISTDNSTVVELFGSYWHSPATKKMSLEEDVKRTIMDYNYAGKRVFIILYQDWKSKAERTSTLTRVKAFLESSETLRYQVSKSLDPMIKSNLYGNV